MWASALTDLAAQHQNHLAKPAEADAKGFVHLLLEITDGVGSIVEWDDLAFSHDPCGRLCSPDDSQMLWISLPKRDRLTLLKYLKTTAHLSERAPW